MPVTLFSAGITITDEMATRLDAMSEAVFLPAYMNTHDGEPPPGWPSPATRKALAEWGIKRLARLRLEQYERSLAEAQVQVPPWSGGDVESKA